MNLSEIGNRIKLCRKEKKLTQERLAELVDVSPHYIYEIERGNKTMSLNILIQISRALSVSTDYILLGYKTNAPAPSDRLNLILDHLSPRERENIADILSSLMPYLKY